MNGKIKYNGTEKIEKRIYDEIEEKIQERLDAIAEETRRSIIQEIREELQPETVPYDRLRLIEQRIHEISITQDGIVREIVDIKTTLNALSKEIDKNSAPNMFETKKPTYEMPSLNSNPYESMELKTPEPEMKETSPASPFSSYTPYLSATESRRAMQPPGFSGNEPSGPATPIVPVTFNSRRTDGWEYQEFVPPKKNQAEPEKFVPAKTIPADNDPFYFADGEEEILDVSPLREPIPPEKSAYSAPSFENIPLTIQKIKPEEKDVPDRAEYIIGNNQSGKRAESDEDYNSDCEYIIAEKDTGQRRQGGRRGGKPQGEMKEKVVASDEDDTEIITYE